MRHRWLSVALLLLGSLVEAAPARSIPTVSPSPLAGFEDLGRVAPAVPTRKSASTPAPVKAPVPGTPSAPTPAPRIGPPALPVTDLDRIDLETLFEDTMRMQDVAEPVVEEPDPADEDAIPTEPEDLGGLGDQD